MEINIRSRDNISSPMTDDGGRHVSSASDIVWIFFKLILFIFA